VCGKCIVSQRGSPAGRLRVSNNCGEMEETVQNGDRGRKRRCIRCGEGQRPGHGEQNRKGRARRSFRSLSLLLLAGDEGRSCGRLNIWVEGKWEAL